MPKPVLSLSTPLQPQGKDDAIADFISALLNDGTYDPAVHGISDHHIYAHRRVHSFALEYQAKTGHAPTPEQVTRRFADFPYTPDAELSWTVHELFLHTKSRSLRSLMSKASKALVDDDPDGAALILSDGISDIPRFHVEQADAFDTSLYFTDPVEHCPVAGDRLMDATGGIRPGHVWYIGGRPGRGKSWDLLRHAVAASKAGWNVAMFSIEMSLDECRERLHKVAVGSHPDPDTMAQRVQDYAATSSGVINIYDTSMMACSITDIEAYAEPHTLILIDYIGLMPGVGGKDANEQVRLLSKELHLIAQRRKVPIISAAQLNRGGDEGRKTLLESASPSLVDMAQTDGLGWDADLVYFIRGTKGSRVREGRIIKARFGPDGQRWFIDFLPGAGSFNEIDSNTALTYLTQEEQRQTL